MSQSRQLAAILFTDVVGYTALMQRDEEQAIHAIRWHNEAVRKHSEYFGGHIANYYGDGCLVVFMSATDAAHCAIKIQQELVRENIPVRMGLHLGEIFYENDKILGDGVNLASRVQSLGIGKSILMSSVFHDNIKNHSEFKMHSLGHFHFKNVDEEMEVFALTGEGLLVPKKSQMHGKLKLPNYTPLRLIVSVIVLLFLLTAIYSFLKMDRAKYIEEPSGTSIAVLSFSNMTSDKNQEFLSDGIAEEIINSLCKFPELKVAARTSSFSFKNKDIDIKTIGDMLQVSNILEGSVRRYSDTIFITLRLTNASTGFTLMSESYEDNFNNISRLQSSIAIDIARKIGTKFSLREEQLLNKRVINANAYEAYLKGRAQFINGPLNMVSGELFRAKKYFEEAARLDTTFTDAYAYLSLTYFNMTDWALPRSEKHRIESALDSAKLLALKALQLDSLNSAAHLAMGSYYFHDYNWIEAENEKRKAVALNPGGTEEKFILASFLSQFGQTEEALALDRQALEVDPLDLNSKLKYARDLYRARKFNECITLSNQVLQEKPNSGGANQFLWLSYSGLQQWDDAGKGVAKYFELSGDTIHPKFFGEFAYHDAIAKIVEYYQSSIPMEEQWIVLMAMYYAELGDKDNTFKYLNYIIENRLPQISFISQHQFDVLRDDPRYKDLIKRVGLQEYYNYKEK